MTAGLRTRRQRQRLASAARRRRHDDHPQPTQTRRDMRAVESGHADLRGVYRRTVDWERDIVGKPGLGERALTWLLAIAATGAGTYLTWLLVTAP
jgi:hypothetical protein